MAMQQCENCMEFAEDTIEITWPIAIDGMGETGVFFVCVDCFDHLIRMEIDFDKLPEIGSETAQRGYSRD